MSNEVQPVPHPDDSSKCDGYDGPDPFPSTDLGRAAKVKHGISSYANGACRCDVCREARRVYRNAFRLRQRIERGPGCRCNVCTDPERQVNPTEEWRPCHLDSGYEVSNEGRVRNKLTGHVLRPQTSGPRRNYLQVMLGSRRPAKIHQLVCWAFNGPRPSDKPQCAHGNGDTFDNRPENLRWATASENHEDSVRHGTSQLPPHKIGTELGTAKLTPEDVVEIRRLSERGVGARPIAAAFGVSRSAVRFVLSGQSWRHVA